MQTLTIENGTEAWERFEVTPIPVVLKLYFFQVDNPDEVVKGGKPKVSEVGPYVYKEYWKKQDIRIDETSDTVFYRQGIRFEFDQEASGGRSDTDLISVINPVVHTLGAVVEAIPTVDLAGELLEFGLPDLFGENYAPLMTNRVRDILFEGTVVPCARTNLTFSGKLVCSALKHFLPSPVFTEDGKGNLLISVLKFKELGPLYELVLGNKNPEEMGKVISVDGKKEFNSWKCKEANQVGGYDIVMLPPLLSKTSKIPILASELQTTVHLQYKEDSEFGGISGYRFGMTWDILGDIKEDKIAQCYCPGSVKGLTIPQPCFEGKGILDLSSCLDVPAILSLPHFYTASENYLSGVEGLDPNPHLHESFLDIEPRTGVPLRGYKRVQVNVWAKKWPSMRMFKDHVNALVPVFWFEEGALLGEDLLSMLRDQLLTVLQIEEYVRWSLFAVGIAFAVLGTTMAIIRRKQELTLEQASISSED